MMAIIMSTVLGFLSVSQKTEDFVDVVVSWFVVVGRFWMARTI
jgi:hypothetical protein